MVRPCTDHSRIINLELTTTTRLERIGNGKEDGTRRGGGGCRVAHPVGAVNIRDSPIVDKEWGSMGTQGTPKALKFGTQMSFRRHV